MALLRLLWLLVLDAGAELEARLELEELNLLEELELATTVIEELELATTVIEELELSTAALLTWPPDPPPDEPPPQLGRTQAHSKQALKRLYMFGLNIVIVEDVSKGIVMFASKRELIALWLLLMIVHK